MGERRLKRFILLLVLFSIFLAARALHIQVLQASHWSDRAEGLKQKVTYTDTVRGRILDLHGRELATDEPCIDVSVDYRAIMARAEEKWLREQAVARLRNRPDAPLKGKTRDERTTLITAEMDRVQEDIEAMFIHLAQIRRKQSNDTLTIQEAISEVQETRADIEQRIEMRERHISFKNYSAAREKYVKEQSPAWYKNILGLGGDEPKRDSFRVEVAEQIQPHVILRAVDAETYNELAKNSGKYPGLVLQSSKRRAYPQGEAGCHFIGRLSRISAADYKKNIVKFSDDPLRGYGASDLIGRTGLEALCEQELRGSRGQTTLAVGEEQGKHVPAQNGKDVHSTVDIELQAKLQKMFLNTPVTRGTGDGFKTERVSRTMHGAIVLIDIPTGEVRALASYPDFDLDKLDADKFKLLNEDDYNKPMLNRATQQALEPGSTVKPIIGIGAITSGVMRPDELIQCNGWLEIAGVRRQWAPKCWVLSMFMSEWTKRNELPINHPTPPHDPCRTHGLDLSEAIKRSCNIYFETAAHRLSKQGVGLWFDRFGLGRRTGIGITESAGRQIGNVDFTGRRSKEESMTWYAGIGQGEVLATPLQMCNVAATIARDGVWMRPTLVQIRQRPEKDIVKLDLLPEAIRFAREGMRRVVSEPAGGGHADLDMHNLHVAAKSGSAQASKFLAPIRDEDGKIIDFEKVTPSTFDNPNPLAPWYLMTGYTGMELTHSWFIGFAPAENPKIAFAVLVEYGGSGGGSAAPMARRVLEACIDHGYLSRSE